MLHNELHTSIVLYAIRHQLCIPYAHLMMALTCELNDRRHLLV
jgi:hypothetical protein